jgi:hypothetical protein
LVYSSYAILIRCGFTTPNAFQSFCYLFYATIGLISTLSPSINAAVPAAQAARVGRRRLGEGYLPERVGKRRLEGKEKPIFVINIRELIN